jgi:hypothetical protein
MELNLVRNQECTYRSIRIKGILHQRRYERIQVPLLAIAYTLSVDATSMGVGQELRFSILVRIHSPAVSFSWRTCVLMTPLLDT